MKDVAQAHEPSPRILGDFILGERLGEGGFGTVYRAEQRTLGRQAVVKVIRRSLVANRDAAERFALEARLASRFEHPFAAHVYAFGSEPDGSMWIAMELVRGTPLDEMVAKTGPISIERFVPLMERLCDVIQAAHEQQIVHRDIKPSNVMVIARNGRLTPKLLDFGIAKTLDRFEPSLSIAADKTTRQSQSSIPTASSAVSRNSNAKVALELTMDASASARESRTDGSLDATIAPPTPSPASAFDDTSASLSGPPHGDPAIENTAVSASGNSESLTRAGQLLGSPPYMAPEQWTDAGSVGAWTDQYSLGLVAYEALVGKRAVTGNSLEVYREAHANAPLPQLPPHLPAKLYDVLARATAKDPKRRYPSLAELANAFREAAFDGALRDELPIAGLSFELRVRWLDAPSPIAEAIASLSNVHSAARVIDRARGVASTIVRWAGVLALACQSRVGRLLVGSSAHDLLLATRRRTLRDTEWLALLKELVLPFASHAEAYPIPELVQFADESATRQLRALLDEQTAFGTSESSLRGLAERCIEQLGAVLETVPWMIAYRVVHVTSRGCELWNGAPVDERPLLPGTLLNKVVGDVLVVDVDNAPVVRLSPVVQIAAPLPDHREEMFLFSGPAHDQQRSRSISYPRGYERDDDAVWGWFATALLTVDESSQTDAMENERSPYPGLAAFTREDRASYVGREREVEELVNRLRGEHLVAIVGPSGVGKSSFVAAGVIPALPPSWRTVFIRPGASPLVAIASFLRSLSPYRDAPHDMRSADELVAAICARVSQEGGTLVIIVDQTEELFTMCSDESARTDFASVLARVAANEQVRVVLSMRDDFLLRLDALEPWRGKLARNAQLVRMLSAKDLERVITVPASRCGYDFDDPSLPSRIVADVVDQPGALPLLAFAASQLWERRDRHFKRLTKSAYEQIGGVAGALVQHADGVVDGLHGSDRRLVRLAFRRLLTAEGTRVAVGRSELVSALGVDGERVIERLLSARLVVSRDDDAGEKIEVIHESLANTWPRLAAWRHEDAASTRMHERLAAAARHWNERGRPDSLLWRGAVLVDLEKLESEGLQLSVLEREFARASTHAARRGRRRKAGVVGVAFVVLASGTVALALANRAVSAQKREAVDRLAASYEQHGRLALEEGDAARALLFLTESRRLGTVGPANDLLVAQSAVALESNSQIVGHIDSPITIARFDTNAILTTHADRSVRRWSDGRPATIASNARAAAMHANGVVVLEMGGDIVDYAFDGQRRWKTAMPFATSVVAGAASDDVVVFGSGAKLVASNGTVRAELVPSTTAVQNAAFHPALPLVAIGEVAGGVSVFDATTGALRTRCTAHDERVAELYFSPDRRTLVTTSYGNDIQVCDLDTGALRHRLLGHRSKVAAVSLSADGRVAASGARDGAVFLWDLERGVARSSFMLSSSVRQIALSPDAKQIATSTRNGSVQIWDRETGAMLGTLHGHAGVVAFMKWEGSNLLTTSMDGSIRRWDVRHAMRTTVGSFERPVTEFHQVGKTSVAIDAAGSVLLVRGGIPSTLSMLGRPMRFARVSPDERSLLVIDKTGVTSTWSLEPTQPQRTLSEQTTTAEFLPDGSIVAISGTSIHWWSADRSSTSQVSIGFDASRLVSSSDGRYVAALSPNASAGEAVVFDVSSRALVSRLPVAGISYLAFGADRVAVSSDGKIDVYELATWRRVWSIPAHQFNVHFVLFLRDGRMISSGQDGKLLAWTRDGQLAQTLITGGDVLTDLAVSPDGQLLAGIGYEGSLRVFDTKMLSKLLVLRGHRTIPLNLQFADNDTALSVSREGQVIRWILERESRAMDSLTELVRCRVPLQLEGDAAVPRKLDLDDPTCALTK